MNNNNSIPEQKTESFAVFQASSILLGMLTQIEDTYKFYAVLASSLILLIFGMVQRTYMKIKLNGKDILINDVNNSERLVENARPE